MAPNKMDKTSIPTQQRQRRRSVQEELADCKKQRDAAAGLVLDANVAILRLTRELKNAQVVIDDLRLKVGPVPSSRSE